MDEKLQRLSQTFLQTKSLPYKRYLIKNETFANKISILVGQRGIGKTTTLIQLLLQHVDGDYLDPRILYIQADHFLMGRSTLYEIAEDFVLHGGKWIAFDEIHKYPAWSQELKSIYDTFGSLKVFASGSSALEIYKGTHDLTRRASVYRMKGMSLREYVEIECQLELCTYSLQEICDHHGRIADEIIQILAKKEKHILPLFHRYLQFGYYPYFYALQDGALYKLALEKNVHTTIESDLAAIYPHLTGASIQKIKKLLIFIANSVPFTPNWQSIQTALEIGDLRTLKSYFSHLEDAGLIATIPKASEKLSQIEAPAKVYLENTNLLYAISSTTPEKGTIRETFFLNAVSQKYQPKMLLQGDFLIEDKVFEVGGKNKSFQQIKDKNKSYLACDDIEMGIGAKIPLWLFGFLY